MDLEKRQKEITQEYQKNQQLIQQLLNRQQQLLGMLSLIEELKKENSSKVEGKENPVKKTSEAKKP